MLKYLGPLLLILACSDAPPTTPETRPEAFPNADNTAIYDVDPDDPYEIDDGSFLDLRPGGSVADFPGLLRPDTLRDGEGSLAIYSIVNGEKVLGYVVPEAGSEGRIERVVITSDEVVTEDGIRIGNGLAELIERIGSVEVHGSEVESRVYAYKDRLSYRLDMLSSQYALDPESIDSTALITQIVINP